jgi:hypothetical protein
MPYTIQDGYLHIKDCYLHIKDCYLHIKEVTGIRE